MRRWKRKGFNLLERLVVSLPENTGIFRGPSGDSEYFVFPEKSSVFVYPLTEQNLDNGVLVVGLIDKDGKELKNERFYLPIIAGRMDQLKVALTNFQNLNGVFPSNKQKLELLGEIESCIHGSEIVGPDGLQLF